MRPLVILATFAMMSLVGCAETEQTIRPNGGANLQPRTSTSPVAAPLPVDLQITPPRSRPAGCESVVGHLEWLGVLRAGL